MQPVDTQSADDMEQMPSTEKQRVLGHMLAEELKELGVSDVREDENGYVYGVIPQIWRKAIRHLLWVLFPIWIQRLHFQAQT